MVKAPQYGLEDIVEKVCEIANVVRIIMAINYNLWY